MSFLEEIIETPLVVNVRGWGGGMYMNSVAGVNIKAS